MLKELLSDSLWREVAALATNHRRLRAAIAYVTTRHITFGRDDLLVCDASDEAIAGGLTSSAVLRTFVNLGADVYSYPGLHSKAAVIDEVAMIGSANLSAGAGVRTCEAALVTDDPQVVALVLAFVEQVRREANAVDSAFLDRADTIPVTRVPPPSRRVRGTRLTGGRSRVWFASTGRLRESLVRAESTSIARGMRAAKRRRTTNRYEVEWLRWSGNSRFRREAKAGDTLVEAFTEKRGTRIFTEVYPPAPIVYRQDEANWTRFYLERPADEGFYLWRDVATDFRKLGATHIKRRSTCELTGSALGILQLLK